jgi:hypothetical protein
MKTPQTLFDRTISRPRPWWVILCVGVLLFSLPFIAAYLDGVWNVIYQRGLWRTLLAPPAIILYILAAAPILDRFGGNVTTALRPMVQIDDASFDRLVNTTGSIPLWQEIFACGLGGAFGLWLGIGSGFSERVSWLSFYWILFSTLMWGLLAWTVFISLASTRLTVALHKQPMKVDIFNLQPFEPIGRQSLVLALVFVIGISLSLLFSFQTVNLREPVFWLVYVLLASVPVFIFFLNMRPTHQVLAAEKKRQQEMVQRQIGRAGQDLLEKLEQKPDADLSLLELNALIAYEGRLKETRTWPYNTSIIRSLFFSVLIPLATFLVRLVIEFLFQ